MPYASGPTIESASDANGVFSTARRTRVFLTTLKYTPEARAFARSFVMSATAMPRFSTMTMAWAPATCFATSATTACFCSRFKPKVYLHSSAIPHDRSAGSNSVTLRQENPVLRDTICAGFGWSVAGQRGMPCQRLPRPLSIKPSPLRSLTARIRAADRCGSISGRSVRCGVPSNSVIAFSLPDRMPNVTPAPAARGSTCRRGHPRPSCSTR